MFDVQQYTDVDCEGKSKQEGGGGGPGGGGGGH